jgi:cell division topological specificity factor
LNRENGPRALQLELVGVISKYVKSDSNDIQVKLERQDALDALEVKVETPPQA